MNSLSGYLESPNGRLLTFSIQANHHIQPGRAMIAQIDSVVVEMGRSVHRAVVDARRVVAGVVRERVLQEIGVVALLVAVEALVRAARLARARAPNAPSPAATSSR